MPSKFDALFVGLALAGGALAAYVDTRPRWDDAGIIAGVLFMAGLGLALTRPRMAIPIGIALGAVIPCVEVARDRNLGSLLALMPALIGALSGAALRQVMKH